MANTTSFTDYVTEFWVEGHRFLWNHYQTEGPRTTNHQPAGRLAQQDQEESSPCPPKHLPGHRGTTEYPSNYRMHHHPVRSRRGSLTKETQIQSDRHHISTTQRQVPARTHQRGRQRRRSIPSPSLCNLNQQCFF